MLDALAQCVLDADRRGLLLWVRVTRRYLAMFGVPLFIVGEAM